MTVAAYPTTIKAGGAAVAFTEEATTEVTANTVFQITDTSKRIIDPATTLLVEYDEDGGGAGAYEEASHDEYSVDYLFGTVTFHSALGASATVRVTGAYIPTTAIAQAKEFTLTTAADVLDKTPFNTGD